MSETKTPKTVLKPENGRLKVMDDLIVRVDKDADPDSDWFVLEKWQRLRAVGYYWAKLNWLLTTNIIFTETKDNSFTREQVKECFLCITKDSLPFELKVRLVTESGDCYESDQMISPRVYLTELSKVGSHGGQRICIEWGSGGTEQFTNPNYMLMLRSLKKGG